MMEGRGEDGRGTAQLERLRRWEAGGRDDVSTACRNVVLRLRILSLLRKVEVQMLNAWRDIISRMRSNNDCYLLGWNACHCSGACFMSIGEAAGNKSDGYSSFMNNTYTWSPCIDQTGSYVKLSHESGSAVCECSYETPFRFPGKA